MQMTIMLDREKVEKDGKYDFADMYRCIDEIFKKRGVNVSWDGHQRIYKDDTAEAFSNFGICMEILEHTDWFIRYVKKWHWLADENDEDVLQEVHAYEGKKEQWKRVERQ